MLVIEAALRSGSLVTRAARLNRADVFALPGPIGSPGSEGTHWLIKQGATLVTTPEDILENLQYGLHWLPTTAENSLYSLNQDEAALPFPELLG